MNEFRNHSADQPGTRRMERLADMYPLKIPVLTLVQLAAVKVADRLWKLPDTKRRLKLCIRVDKSPMKLCCKMRIDRKRSFRAVFGNIDQLEVLPPTLRSHVKYVAMQLGINTFRWLHEHKALALEDTADNLQFDHMAFVDSAGTIRSLYYNGKLPRTRECIKLMFDFALEDCIRDYWSNFTVQDGISELERILVSPDGQPYLFIDHWRSYIEALSLDVATQEGAGKIKPMEGIPLKIPTISYRLFNYFWSNITDRRRRECLTLMEELDETALIDEELSFTIDRINFVLNSVAETGRTDFQEKNSSTLEKLVISIFTQWPYRHLFLPTVTPALSHMSPELYLATLHEILKISYLESQLLDSELKYRNYMMHLWKNVPESVRLEFLSIGHSRVAYLIIVMIVSDVELLMEFFQDEDLSVVRAFALTPSPTCMFQNLCFKTLEYFKMLEEFMQRILKSDEERTLFKKNFDISEMHLWRGFNRNLQETWTNYVYWRYNCRKEIDEALGLLRASSLIS